MLIGQGALAVHWGHRWHNGGVQREVWWREEGAASKQKQSGWKGGRKRNRQVGLIRFDFHLHLPLPQPLSRTLSHLAVSLITPWITKQTMPFLIFFSPGEHKESNPRWHADIQGGRDRASRYSCHHVAIKCTRLFCTQHHCGWQILEGIQSVSVSFGVTLPSQQSTWLLIRAQHLIPPRLMM